MLGRALRQVVYQEVRERPAEGTVLLLVRRQLHRVGRHVRRGGDHLRRRQREGSGRPDVFRRAVRAFEAQGLRERHHKGLDVVVVVGARAVRRHPVRGGCRRAGPVVVVEEVIVLRQPPLDSLELFVQRRDGLVAELQLKRSRLDQVAAGAVILLEDLAALDLCQTVARRPVDIGQRHRLANQAEDERHHGLARLGLLAGGAGQVFLPGFVRLLVRTRELELRHAGAVVPEPQAVVVVAARLQDFLMEVAFARAVLDGLREELLVQRLVVLAFRGLPAGARELVHLVVVVLEKGVDVLEGQPARVFLAPVLERDADGLGVVEAGDVVAAEAAEPADGLLAQVELDVVFLIIRDEFPLVLRQLAEAVLRKFALGFELGQVSLGQQALEVHAGQSVEVLAIRFRDDEPFPAFAEVLCGLAEQPRRYVGNLVVAQVRNGHARARVVDVRVLDPLHQPAAGGLHIAIRRDQFFFNLAEARAELRLAGECRQTVGGLQGGLVAVARQAAALREQLPASFLGPFLLVVLGQLQVRDWRRRLAHLGQRDQIV